MTRYPDEAMVFEVRVPSFDYHRGDHVEVFVLPDAERRPCPFRVPARESIDPRCFRSVGLPFDPAELRPLTKAARALYRTVTP